LAIEALGDGLGMVSWEVGQASPGILQCLEEVSPSKRTHCLRQQLGRDLHDGLSMRCEEEQEILDRLA